jgi:hypothetical protein
MNLDVGKRAVILHERGKHIAGRKGRATQPPLRFARYLTQQEINARARRLVM